MKLTTAPVLRAVLALASCLAFACGGQVVQASGDGGGGDFCDGSHAGCSSGGGSGGSSGSSSGADASSFNPGPDAMANADATVGAVTCQGGPATMGGSSSGCNVASAETCTDGSYYAVSCSCPAATCQCSETFSGGSGGGGGSSGGNIPYSGCASMCMDLSLAYTSCGFPVPQ